MSETSPSSPAITLDEDAVRGLLRSLNPDIEEYPLDMAAAGFVLLIRCARKHQYYYDVVESIANLVADAEEKHYRDLGLLLTMVFGALPETREVLEGIRKNVPGLMQWIEIPDEV